MLKLNDRIDVLEKLGHHLSQVATGNDAAAFGELCQKAFQKNNWFTPENITFAASVWGETLTRENLLYWISLYENQLKDYVSEKKVGVINAGNIPFVGMHDLISVFLSGLRYIGKNASEDPYLLPWIVDMMIGIEPGVKDRFQFVEKLSGMDAVIGTGNNNSARYFEYYFGKYPHVIRKNRNAVAVITGAETPEEMKTLGEDIFRYFGLGCRNVSKLCVPRGYDFKNLFEPMESFAAVAQHHKYMNNFEYNNAMLLMKQVPFLTNGFLIVREEKQVASPIAVLHYEQYGNIEELSNNLDAVQEHIQCVVTNEELILKTSLHDRMVGFGEAQHPLVWEYADGVDTLSFLNQL